MHGDAKELLLALEKIDAVQREVVVMRFLMGFSLQEAAATLELSTREPPMLQNSNITQDRPSKAPPKKTTDFLNWDVEGIRV